MPDIKEQFKSEIDAWANSYMNFVMDTMAPEELENLTKLDDSLSKTLLTIIPPRVIKTHYIYTINDIRYLVPKNVTLTDKNKDTLAKLASDPEKYELANPVYVLQDMLNHDRIIIDIIGPTYEPQ